MFYTNINNTNTCKIVSKMQYLKNGLQSNVSDSSVCSINPIPTGIFWPHYHWREVVIENCYWLTWNLTQLLSNLKTFKNTKKIFWIQPNIFYWHHHISAFSAENLAFTCFCWIANFISIFSLLLLFANFNVFSIALLLP